ncbi:MAG: hypothetical protein J0H82_06285 [Alphaproteobacteria bacterium]|jgi:hypothetical protein|nr:hypothetical protein [Alphaproteobacteria bacterium]
MASIYLVEIIYLDPVTVTAEPIYACTGTGFAAPDAPMFYAPSVIQAADLDRTIWSDDRAFGTGKMSLGDIVLSALPLNPGDPPPYDVLQAHGCSVYGIDARLLVVDEDGAYADAAVIYAGPLETFEFSGDGTRVTFRWRDAVASLVDKTAQLTQYLGNNALPSGVEGVTDLKDKWKPRPFGYVQNVAVPCVNTSLPVFQFADSADALPPTSDARVRLMIRGAVMTPGVARASLAALLANSASSGTWDYYIGAEGAFARPAFAQADDGAVTMDIVEGANSAARTAAQIWKRMLVSWGVLSGDISSADITALDAAFPAEAGLWLGVEEVKRRDAVDQITTSATAITWRSSGIWRIRQVTAPSGSPVATFRDFGGGGVTTATDIPIVSLEIIAPDADSGAPTQQVKIEYAKNWTVQNRDQVYGATGMDLARMAFLEKEWRTASTPVDTAVTDTYGNARKITIQSLIYDATAAANLAASIQALLGKTGAAKRSWLRVTCALNHPAVPLIQELSLVRIVFPRYGLDAGRLFRACRIAYDAAANVATFTVWG